MSGARSARSDVIYSAENSIPLLPPQIRKHLHTRRVTFRGYQREDGLWDIEAAIVDVKTYVLKTPDRGTLRPGTPVHDMTISEIVTSMASTPFPECLQARDPMQQMVGCTMGPGWRHTIEKNLGGIRGCAHLRELLFDMATVAYQTISGISRTSEQAGRPASSILRTAAYHLGKWMSWDFNGPVVKRHEPEFFGWQPLKKAAKPA